MNARATGGAMLAGLADIYFVRRWWFALVLIGVLALVPTLLLGGLATMLLAVPAVALLRVPATTCRSSIWMLNLFLVGVAVAARVPVFSAFGFGLLLGASLSCVLMLCVLEYSVKARGGLPLMSVPFSLVATLVFLVAYAYRLPFAVAAPFPSALAFNTGVSAVDLFLANVGAMLFVPYPLAGGLLIVGLLVHSRIMFLLALLGHGAGLLVHAVFAGPVAPLGFVYTYNAILTALALGSGFLVARPRAFGIAVVGAVLAQWGQIGFVAMTGGWLPAFTWPLCAVSIGLVFILQHQREGILSFTPQATPERTLMRHMVDAARGVRDAERLLSLPVAGPWDIWQAVDGEWTHQGDWRWAFDFVIRGSDGATWKNAGTRLVDYYCFQAPVLAPCAGRVVRVIDYLPDNPVAQPDTVHNWGNAIVIEHRDGWFVELSHFAHESVFVREGQQVAPGQLLGYCGNSGYSPEPHVHMQVQATDVIGAPTLPFGFRNVICNGQFHPIFVPATGMVVENHVAATVEPNALARLFDKPAWDDAIPLALAVQVTKGDRVLRDCVIASEPLTAERRRLVYHGSALTTRRSGQLTLFEAGDGSDDILTTLALALPTLPDTLTAGMRWQDTVEANPAAVFWHTWVRDLWALPHPARLCWSASLTVEDDGVITTIVSDHDGHRRFTATTRIDPETSAIAIARADTGEVFTYAVQKADAPNAPVRQSPVSAGETVTASVAPTAHAINRE